jgi:hypothetical protein
MMDKATLEARIEQYESDKQRAIAQVNALDGAIADCKFWIAELDKPVDEPADAKKK